LTTFFIVNYPLMFIMIVGIPKEIKDNEYRVGIVPAGVLALTQAGHSVIVERSAGEGSAIGDEEYRRAGAEIVSSAADVYGRAEMVMKVKEPLPAEYGLLREGQILYAYLHLAPAPELTRALLEKKVIGVAYETIQTDDGLLPLLIPMSEVAGKLAVQAGAHYLEKEAGGRGILLGGVPGVHRAVVTIIGGGTVGLNAAKIAVGMGAEVYIINKGLKRMAYLDDIFANTVTTLESNSHNIEEAVLRSDLVVGSVLIPGAMTPRVVTRSMVSRMKKGAVIVDVAIDQGGCIETSRPTSHSDPVYEVDGVIHYCVTNMPGAVPRTSTYALTNATLPHALAIAGKGLRAAVCADASLARGVNVYKGHVTHPAVAEAAGVEYTPLEKLLGSL